MSYELVNRATEIYRKFSRQAWVKALELAQLHGWKPLGTAPPCIHDFDDLGAVWNGTYLTNDGQAVRAEDARALAAALERSLDHIPKFAPRIDWTVTRWREEELPDWLSPEERGTIEQTLQHDLLDTIAIHPVDFFAGEEKRHLKELIRFCRLGSFDIL